MIAPAKDTRRRTWSNGSAIRPAAPAVGVLANSDHAARAFVSTLLRGRQVPGVSPRLRRQWMATGRPVAELASILRAHPDLRAVVLAYLDGECIADPAPLTDALVAEQRADAAEDVAEVRALLEDTPEAWLEYARLAELAAARLTEAARAARMEASR